MPERGEDNSATSTLRFFNVQTVDPETGDESWITVKAMDADAAGKAAATISQTCGVQSAFVGEIRPADPRVAQSVVQHAVEVYNPLPIEAPLEDHVSEKCGVCGAPMGFDSLVCSLCAYDKRKGLQSSILVRTVASDGHGESGEKGRRFVACKECGYELTGLPSAKCPECGTNNIQRHNLLEGVSEETELAAVRKPIIAIGIGFGVTLAVMGLAEGKTGLIGALMLIGLILPVALIVTSLCLIIWIGVDYTWKLTLLQITGAVALSALCVTVCVALTAALGFTVDTAIVPCMVVGFFSMIAGLAMMLELELTDAALAAVFVTILSIGELLVVFL